MGKLRAKLGGGSDARRGAITLVLIVLAMLAVLANPSQRLKQVGADELEAEVTTASDLRNGSPVRVDGVDVGTVSEIKPTAGGRRALVTMKLDGFDDTIHKDARADLRFRTILGANLFVDLDPGKPASGELGGAPIPVDRTSTQVELDDITTAVGEDAVQAGQRRIVGELARALKPPAALRSALEATGRAAPTVGRGLAALRGERDGDLRRLVSSTAEIATALDAPTEPVRGLVESAATTLETTGARRAALRRTIELAPPVMDRAVTTLGQVDSTLSLADPLVARLREPVRDLGPTARRARPLLTGADALLREAEPTVRALRPAVSRLASTARRGTPLLEQLLPSLRRVDDEVLPALDVPDPVTKFKTYELIGPVTAAAASAGGQFDNGGYWIRFPALGSERSIGSSPCQTFVSDPEKESPEEKFRCDQLFEALGDAVTPTSGGEAR